MIGKILIRAPISLKSRLQGAAKRKGLTLNALILEALWNLIEALELNPHNK